MKRQAMVLGAALVTVVAVGWYALSQEHPRGAATAGGPGRLERAAAAGDLIALGFSSPKGPWIVVVDSRQRSLALYRVDPQARSIHLESVRKIGWDLELEHFNGAEPVPSEIRRLLQGH